MTEQINGADALARIIAGWGQSPVCHVPGEGVLEVLDALTQTTRPLLSFRHEAGAAVAAQAAGQVTGQPGICVVGRAPGALNTALALHTARTDGAPMILIVGQPSRRIAGREPFLANDFAQAFAPMAKWIGEVTEAARLAELFTTAWARALDGLAGPVVLVVAEEVWTETLPARALPAQPPRPARQGIAPDDLAALWDRLAQAQRPLILAGGTGWSTESTAALADFAGHHGLPVATAYRRRDMMPASHPCFVGEIGIGADPALTSRVAEADLVLALGIHLGEINTFGARAFEGYSLLDAPQPAQPLIHVHPDPAELNAVYRADLALCAHPAELLAALPQDATPLSPDPQWTPALRAARQAFTAGQSQRPGPVDLQQVFQTLRAALPADAMLTVGAGAYAHWPQRYFAHEQFGTQLGPKSGAMGYGLPAALGVQASCPGRRVVAVAGDGCFMMQGEELATAAQAGLPVLVIVINNSLYGAIHATQGRQFGRTTGTELAAIHFADLARAQGVMGQRVERTQAFAPALTAALAEMDAGRPALIEIVTPKEPLKP